MVHLYVSKIKKHKKEGVETPLSSSVSCSPTFQPIPLPNSGPAVRASYRLSLWILVPTCTCFFVGVVLMIYLGVLDKSCFLQPWTLPLCESLSPARADAASLQLLQLL